MFTKPGPAGGDLARSGQVALGLLWLVDGALQFQPFMFGRTFVNGVILPASHGQPGIIGGPMVWMAHMIEPHVALFNAGAATLQVLIGLGLLYRPAVKLSLFHLLAAERRCREGQTRCSGAPVVVGPLAGRRGAVAAPR